MKGMTFIEKKLCNSIVIPIAKLHPFEGHPYKVLDNEEMEMLTESVQNEGVLSPLIVRPLEGTDGYEVISGHRRLHAAQLSITITNAAAQSGSWGARRKQSGKTGLKMW